MILPSSHVQLQMLTAVVKLFLYKPDSSQGLVQRVLNTATKDCDSPDVRDRAYIYWRLLSTDPGAAKVRGSNFDHYGDLLLTLLFGSLSYLLIAHRYRYLAPLFHPRYSTS
jgi:hypothetical protein